MGLRHRQHCPPPWLLPILRGQRRGEAARREAALTWAARPSPWSPHARPGTARGAQGLSSPPCLLSTAAHRRVPPASRGACQGTANRAWSDLSCDTYSKRTPITPVGKTNTLILAFQSKQQQKPHCLRSVERKKKKEKSTWANKPSKNQPGPEMLHWNYAALSSLIPSPPQLE